MTTRKGGARGEQADLFDLLAPPDQGQAPPTTGPVPAEADEIELADLRDRLTTALKQARKGMLAASSGEQAIRRAFSAARQKD